MVASEGCEGMEETSAGFSNGDHDAVTPMVLP